MQHLKESPMNATTWNKISAYLLVPFNLLAALVDLVFCIPVIGRLLKWVWNSILTLLHFIFGMIEALLWELGFRPQKKFRIGFLILSESPDKSLISPDKVLPALEKAQQIYAQANIEIIPAFPPPKKLSESGTLPDADHWVRTLPQAASQRILEVDCNLPALLQDFGLPGAQFQYNTLSQFFESGLRRITGYGAPITVMVVKDIGKFGGCSLGWLSDYVTVKFSSMYTTAHELGHACNLLHREDKNNLMHPSSGRQEDIILTNWQVAFLRASRHITYF